ncbi:MAG: YdeI/OmpD-associated family protein [Candidatus Latescibacteria bacterium]|nr:YdeI/OmpD-associated family protein [Candidatus Latescibacterota bacterium]
MKKRFKSTITRAGGKNLIPVPFDPDEVWGAKERHYVDGEVDGHRVRGLLIATGAQIALPVGAAWLRDTQVALDAPVKVVLWPDGPQVEGLAEDIARALKGVPAAKALFDSVAPFYRKNFLRWIDSARRPQTRQVRIAEMVRLLAAGKKQR